MRNWHKIVPILAPASSTCSPLRANKGLEFREPLEFVGPYQAVVPMLERNAGVIAEAPGLHSNHKDRTGGGKLQFG